MKRISLFTIMLMLCLVTMAQREKLRLDDGWKFHFGNASDPQKDFGCGTEYFNYLTKAASIHNEGPYSMKCDDSSWQEVRIPHDWATTLPYAEEASHSHGYKTVGFKYPETSVGWYRHKLTIPATDKGKHISLQFDGIFRNAQVWFNGIFMGTEPSGYATQVYDITEYINYDSDNVICVRADATLEEGWFYEGAGIYRNAWILKNNPVHIANFGTFIYSKISNDFQNAELTVLNEIENSSLATANCTVRNTLLDASGNVIAKAEEANLTIAPKDVQTISDIKINVRKPHVWDIKDPYLYNLRTDVVIDNIIVDTYFTRLGIREVKFTSDEGFFLNGKHIKLKGVNMHQDHAGIGAAMPDALMRWRIKQLKNIGCNAYRASHNPMTPEQLDICDEEGILVIEENRLAGINIYHRRLLENMIRRDRNHPSIILWSNANEEWGLEHNETGRRIAESMREITKRLDPSRHSTIANAGGAEMIKGADVVGYNYIIQNDVHNRRKAHPDWKIVGTEETTGCGTRGIYFNNPEKPWHMASLNRIPLTKDWQIDYSTSAPHNTPESYTQGIERGWKFYRDTPWAAGCFYWTGFDYRGEPNPLKFPAHDSQFGLLDYCGFLKDEAYYLKAAWTDEIILHILPHWNLKGYEGKEISIWAYSNCDEVELSVNGKNLGRQKMPKDGHLTWKAVYKQGKVVAAGYKNGKKIITKTIETTSNATSIKAYADRTELQADGNDVAIINIDLNDKKGRLVPDACNNITFTLHGEGRIIGAGNGDPACMVRDNPNNKDCKQFIFPAFNGHAQLLVQTTKNAGNITIECSADGLNPNSINIKTIK